MKKLWDSIHSVYQNTRGKAPSVLVDCKFIPSLNLTIISEDNYYLVNFDTESNRTIEFKIEKEYNLIQNKEWGVSSKYHLSKVSVDGMYLPGDEDALLEFINTRLVPIMRESKLVELGI